METGTIEFSLTIDIYRPLEQVFAFIAAPENDFYWQYGTLVSDRQSRGAVGMGTIFRTVGHFMGRRFESVYEVIQFAPNTRYGFKSLSGPIDSYRLYTFETVRGSTRLGTSVQIRLGEPFRPNPIGVAKVAKKEHRENLALLKSILEATPVSRAARRP